MSAEIIRLARAKRTIAIPAQEKSRCQPSEVVLSEGVSDRPLRKAHGDLLSAIAAGVVAAWIVDA
jgi:hypothetical protein